MLVAEAARGLAAYFGFIAVAMAFGLPLSPATLLAVKVAPPWLVALVAALAAAVDGLVDYVLVGRALRIEAIARLTKHRVYARFERAARIAPFVTTGVFAGFPLPFILCRVFMPAIGYPRWRYVLAMSIGRFLRILVIATFGSFVDVPTPWLVALLVAGVAASGAAAVVRWLLARRRAPTTCS